MTDKDINHLHPDLIPLAEQWLATCHRQSIEARIYFTWRSYLEQDALYAIGRTKPGKIITNARGGFSKHNFTIDGKPASKAFDFFIQNADGTANWNPRSIEWQTAIAIGKALGLRSGADWMGTLYDADHLELAE